MCPDSRQFLKPGMPYRSSSKICVSGYEIALGQRSAAAHLSLGAALVPARTRRHLFNRLRIALGPSGRPCRQQWDLARKSIPASSSGPLGKTLTDCCRSCAGLTRTMRFFIFFAAAAFSVVAIDFRNRSGGFTPCSFVFVLIAHNRWARLFQFSVGHSFAGDRVFSDLFRAVAAVATGSCVVAGTCVSSYTPVSRQRCFCSSCFFSN